MTDPHSAAAAPTIRGADLIARQLKAAGATHAFGIPGGEVLALVDALEQAGIAFRLARHENAAGFMAEGRWHATGALPVLVATLGPGVANAVNVVANAQQDRVPLVFVTGCVDAALAERYTHQVFDHQAVLRPLVKGTFRAERGTEALVVQKAVALARRGRPGPVHIDLPIGVAEGPAPDRPALPHLAPTQAVAADLSAAQALIARASRPLVLAGLDIVNEGSAAQLEAFVAATGAPLLTTYKAKGVIAEDDPRVVGAVGLSPKADTIVRPLLESADLIVLAGYDPIEMRAGWCDPWPDGVPVLDIVAEAMTHGMHRSTLILEGHVGETLARLTPQARPSGWGDIPAGTRSLLRDAFAAREAFGPHRVFEILRAAAPSQTIVSADSGAHRILLSQAWTCPAPRTLVQSTGLCTMGCALPLAAGAALGSGRPALCVVGDAGLDMVLGELSTIRNLGVPVVVAVLVDDSLGLIELKQRQQGLDNGGVDFEATDFAAVAHAMGGFGATVGDAAALEREAAAAFGRSGFTVLACRIGRRAYDGAF